MYIDPRRSWLELRSWFGFKNWMGSPPKGQYTNEFFFEIHWNCGLLLKALPNVIHISISIGGQDHAIISTVARFVPWTTTHTAVSFLCIVLWLLNTNKGWTNISNRDTLGKKSLCTENRVPVETLQPAAWQAKKVSVVKIVFQKVGKPTVVSNLCWRTKIC